MSKNVKFGGGLVGDVGEIHTRHLQWLHEHTANEWQTQKQMSELALEIPRSAAFPR